MKNNLSQVCACIAELETYLNLQFGKPDDENSQKKLWKNTYIYHQIQKRKQGGKFTIQDHIRGMVYSMLTSGISWNRIVSEIDVNTGEIPSIDEVFCYYNPEALLSISVDSIKEKICGTYGKGQYNCRIQQIDDLLLGNGKEKSNIQKLMEWEEKYTSIDCLYQKWLDEDSTYKKLIKNLSGSSDYKLKGMGVPLTAEYLRNVGYDISKPDRHIIRILGKERFNCLESAGESTAMYEAMDIVCEIAKEMNRSVAEVDYILWSYCASGYGEICGKIPKCDLCCLTDKICDIVNKKESL